MLVFVSSCGDFGVLFLGLREPTPAMCHQSINTVYLYFSTVYTINTINFINTIKTINTLLKLSILFILSLLFILLILIKKYQYWLNYQ